VLDPGRQCSRSSSVVPACPMQHPELATVLWSMGLIAVFAPLAVHLYRIRCT